MSFVLRMAARDVRGAWQRLVFFFFCVAIGVGAIVALRSVIQSVRGALVTEARTLSAADVVMQSNSAWSENALAIVDDYLARRPEIERTASIETATMVRPADEAKAVAKMVELRAVQPGFPFYGDLRLAGGRPYAHDLLADGGILVRPELLAQLDVAVGEAVVVGSQTLRIRGVIEREPGAGFSAFSFGPRVIVDYAMLGQSGLLTVGSRARYQVLLRMPETEVDTVVEELDEALTAEPVRVRSYRRTENRLGSNLQRAENYLSLVGFVILVLGGIGVWSVTRVFVQQKLRSIAVLKCLGASGPQILAIYVLEILLLAGGGSLLGIGLAAVAVAAVPDAASLVATADVTYALTWSAVLQGVGVGMLVALLFAVAPLLDVRHVKPLLLLREEARGDGVKASDGIDWLRVGVTAGAVVGLVGLAGWQAGSARIGLFVCLGFAGVALLLSLAGAGLVRLVSPLAGSKLFPLRHAVVSLSRPGNQTRVILLAVGIGSFFIIGVRALQVNLLREFAVELQADGPDLFLIDIQEDQAEGVRSMLEQRQADPGAAPRLLPVVRARVTGVEGREVNLDGYEDVRGRGSLGREYVLTYRNTVDVNERVVEGTFWGDRGDQVREVSIEDSIRDRFDIQIGDLMRFEILGRSVEVRVSNVRAVDWEESRAGSGFMFVLSPAALATAPHSYIAMVRGPEEPAARARLQRDLVASYPNVSAIDMREILLTVERVVASVTFAITMVGGVVLFTGTLILVGAVAMTKYQRIYEAAIFKTLGATSRTIATMLALEYGTLGTLAGLIGSLGAIVLSWTLSRYVLEIAWAPALLQNAAGIVMTALVVGVVGVVASYDVLRNKPLATLRGE